MAARAAILGPSCATQLGIPWQRTDAQLVTRVRPHHVVFCQHLSHLTRQAIGQAALHVDLGEAQGGEGRGLQ